MTKGAIVSLLHNARKWLGASSEEIKKEIQATAISHADEAG